jgi:hypothetical protein
MKSNKEDSIQILVWTFKAAVALILFRLITIAIG